MQLEIQAALVCQISATKEVQSGRDTTWRQTLGLGAGYGVCKVLRQTNQVLIVCTGEWLRNKFIPFSRISMVFGGLFLISLTQLTG